MRQACEWAAHHGEELIKRWDVVQDRQPLVQKAQRGAILPRLQQVPPLVHQLVVVINALDCAAIGLSIAAMGGAWSGPCPMHAEAGERAQQHQVAGATAEACNSHDGL